MTTQKGGVNIGPEVQFHTSTLRGKIQKPCVAGRDTVELLMIHIPRWIARAMSYEGSVLRGQFSCKSQFGSGPNLWGIGYESFDCTYNNYLIPRNGMPPTISIHTLLLLAATDCPGVEISG